LPFCARLEEAPMFEAVLGLIVALALGVYLIITLIAPEKF
jgi:K+-transporting ATPase KdpF subunit